MVMPIKHIIITSFNHFVIMDPLVKYYARQALGGRVDNGVGPFYIFPPFVQCGNGIGSFLGGIFRTVTPLLWSAAKAKMKELGNEALRIGGKILTVMADNPMVSAREIFSKNVKESLQNLSFKIRG